MLDELIKNEGPKPPLDRVEVPQEAFVAALATDADIEKIKAARKAGN